MAKLEIGESIKLQSGGKITVLEELGEGGQGYVYRVKDESGLEYALKWYKTIDEQMYKNINTLIERGSPSDEYLWPIMLTQKKGNYYGYLMQLRPSGFKDIIKGREVVNFNDFNDPVLTKITIAIK